MTRNKIIYFPGIFISLLGSVLFSFATGMYLLDTTQKGSSYAINIILYTVPIVVLSPIFGMWIDRYSKKKLIVFGDFLNGLLMMGIFFLWGKVDNVILIYSGTVLTSIFSLLVSIGFEAGKPQMFDKSWLTKANSISSIINSGSRIVGPILGGLVYAFIDIKAFIFFNGLSFFFSMLTELFLTIKETKVNRESKEKTRLTEGLKYIKSNKKFRKYVIFLTILNFSFPMSIMVSIPYIITNTFNYDSKILGGVQSVFSIGIILGAILIGKYNVNLSFKFIKIIFTSFILINLLFLIPLFVTFDKTIVIGIYSLAMLLVGGVVASVDIPLFTYFQKELPDHIRGQVIGLFFAIAKTIMPISLLLSGKIIDVQTPAYSIGLGIFPIIISLVFFVLFPQKESDFREEVYQSK